MTFERFDVAKSADRTRSREAAEAGRDDMGRLARRPRSAVTVRLHVAARNCQ